MSDEIKAKRARREDTAAERWNRAVREAYTVDAAEPSDVSDVLEASDEEIERQLRAAGVDLAAEDAKAAATYDAMIAKLEADRRRLAAVEDVDGRRSDVAWVASTDVPARAAVRPARRCRAVWLVCAVAAAAATGSAAYVAGHQRHEEPKHEEPVVPPKESAPVPVSTVAPPAPAPQQTPPPPPNDKSDKKAPR